MLKEHNDPKLTLIASGSEVQLVLDAANKLEKNGINANVVSMPCLDIFLDTDDAYQSSVIKTGLPILAVELGHPNSWYKLLNKNDKVLGIDSFGESAPANVLLEHFGFTIPNVVDIAKSLVDA